MNLKLILLNLFFLFFSINIFAFKVVEDVATKAGGYDIPIKVCLPEKTTGKMPPPLPGTGDVVLGAGYSATRAGR